MGGSPAWGLGVGAVVEKLRDQGGIWVGKMGGSRNLCQKINEQFIKSIFFSPRLMARLHFSACFQFHAAM